jgi:hypothetical protein
MTRCRGRLSSRAVRSVRNVPSPDKKAPLLRVGSLGWHRDLHITKQLGQMDNYADETWSLRLPQSGITNILRYPALIRSHPFRCFLPTICQSSVSKLLSAFHANDCKASFADIKGQVRNT